MSQPAKAVAAAARPPFKVKDLGLAELGRKEIRLAEQEMPGLMALRARHAGSKPLARRADHGLAAHDRADRRADRDARRPRRRRALGVVQHLQHPGLAPPPRSPSAATARVENPRGAAVFAWKGETLEEYWWCTNEALVWPDGGGPDLIVDDGGDATLLVHKGLEFERAGSVPAFDAAERARGVGHHPRPAAPAAARGAGTVGAHLDEDPRRQRGDHHRRAPPLRDGEEGHAALPRDQRERLGHQDEVRQHLRLPPLADRRPQPRHRRHAGRQDRGRVRLRRGRQGLRRVAARPGLPRDRHRDRPDLRAAGGDAGLRGGDARGLRRARRRLRHRHRQLRHHHRRPHGAHEGQGDRRQHRPLRQRDRHGRPRQGARHRSA